MECCGWDEGGRICFRSTVVLLCSSARAPFEWMRTKSPTKSSSSRSISSRPASASLRSPSPVHLSIFGISAMGIKRALTPDPEATTSGTTSAAEGETKKRRKDKKKKRDKVVVPVEVEEIEEGEVDTNADLFMIDLEPMVIPVGVAFEEVIEVEEEVVAPVVELKTKKQRQEEEAALMKAFKEEVAMDDDSGMDDDDDVEEESEDEVETLIIHENPETLEKAIKGKITDDSAAKVTGRYYKEDDLTRSCGMCGGASPSSYRDSSPTNEVSDSQNKDTVPATALTASESHSIVHRTATDKVNQVLHVRSRQRRTRISQLSRLSRLLQLRFQGTLRPSSSRLLPLIFQD